MLENIVYFSGGDSPLPWEACMKKSAAIIILLCLSACLLAGTIAAQTVQEPNTFTPVTAGKAALIRASFGLA